MTATFKGITLTGTPAEIAAFTRNLDGETPAAAAPDPVAPPVVPVNADTSAPPRQQTFKLGRTKTQPRLLVAFKGMPHQQFLSGVFAAWKNLASSPAFDADGYISAKHVFDTHLVGASESNTKEYINAMKLAGLVRETNRHGRPYYRVFRDIARAEDAVKSAKFKTSGQRSVYFTRPVAAADV
jgi:hypothetical protein